MLPCNAQSILELKRLSRQLMPLKSPLSRECLLCIASEGGVCDLRQLLKSIDATPVAIRQHVQFLIDAGYVELAVNSTNRRCKLVRMSDKGRALMRVYEQRVQDALKGWLIVA